MNIEGTLFKNTIDKNGIQIRQDDVIESNEKEKSQDAIFRATQRGIQNEEGCNIVGEVKIHKVPGNFHISSHGLNQAVQQIY